MSVVHSQGGMSFAHAVSGARLVISRLAVLPPLPGGRARKSSSLFIVAKGVGSAGVACFLQWANVCCEQPQLCGTGAQTGTTC